jgi:Zn-dependent metalloprotease
MVKFTTAVVFILICTASVFAFTSEFTVDSREISVAYYDQQPEFLSHISPVTAENRAWSAFVRAHGVWTASVNSLTGNLYRAWGGAIPVGIASDQESAENKALGFIRSESELLNVPIDQLYLIHSRHRGHHWFVDFGQKYQGLEVFSGRVSVRISDRGNVVLFENDYYQGIQIPITPALSPDASRSAAGAGLSSELNYSEPALIVFPLPTESGFDYRLAYSLEISNNEPSKYQVIVDANTGEILYRKSLIYYATVDGSLYGKIYPTTPFDSLETRPFEFGEITISAMPTAYTDTVGFFSVEVPNEQSRYLYAGMQGLYVDVVNSQGNQASLTDTITPGETLYVEWNATNSRNDERNAYYQTNVVHDFINAIDPDFTDLDYPMTCNVNLNETCNAYWDGSSINFFMSGGGCSNTGEIADVIYHEYGHGITDFQYRPSSPSGAQHEGWSDYTAATITNQPLIGRGFYSSNPDQYLRTVDNTNHYPEDWHDESHNDGLIVAGALWDLREALAPRTGYCDSLFHFARYGLSSNYQDYLVDMLIYDDDDDNLFNLTPHWTEIITAFDLHGITPLDVLSIAHTPLDDTQNTSLPYDLSIFVTFTFTPPNPDSVFIFYRTSMTGPFTPLHMTIAGNQGEFVGSIPAQPLLTPVEYYISLTDMMGRTFLKPATAPVPSYFFFVGQLDLNTADSLERVTAWVAGDGNDDATSGVWVRVNPVGTYSDSMPDYPYQTEDDHTPDPGVYCYITGQQPAGDPNNGANDVDGGRTSLFSPVYNLQSYRNPIIEYYRWFTSSRNVDDTFYVDLSSDNGATWMPIENLTITENYWAKSRIVVRQFTDQLTQLKLRFIALDEGAGSIVEGGVDDISIYDTPVDAIDGDNIPKLPTSFVVRDNYPNPFNSRTEISFDLPVISDVAFMVYDITGSLVHSERFQSMSPGTHSITWDTNTGVSLASGVYFYKIQAGAQSISRKMLLVK